MASGADSMSHFRQKLCTPYLTLPFRNEDFDAGVKSGFLSHDIKAAPT